MSREQLNQSFASLLQTLQTYKAAAAQKSAGLGETSHPVMGASNGTKATTEGERSRENESDLKAQETPMAAEAASAPPGGDQEDLTPKFGPITPKETGHDPGSETESTKDTKQDPGTAHPAKVAYASSNYQKEATALTAQLTKVSKSAEQLLGVLLSAQSDSEKPQSKQATAQATSPKQPASSQQASKAEIEKAAAAGQDLANVFAGMDIQPEDKQAADAYVFGLVRQAIAAGVNSADQYVKVASGFFAQKQANEDEGNSPAVEEESEEDSEPAEGDEEGSEGGEASGVGPEISDDSMPSEEEIIALLTGQGMSPDGGGGGGGMPPGAGPMGAPEEMMAGGGEEIDPELIQALLAELQASGMGGGGDGGGGMPPEAGGGAPPMVDPAAMMGGDPMAGKMAANKNRPINTSSTKVAAARKLAKAIIKVAGSQPGKRATNGKSAKASRTSQAQKMLLELMGTGR